MNDQLNTRQLLACLGDESRFRVMGELIRGDRCVTDLAKLVGLSQSCTTRHLQVLERVGLVRSTRLGKRVVFSVATEPRVASLLAWALPVDVEGDISRWPSPGADGEGTPSQPPEVTPAIGSSSDRGIASRPPRRPRDLEDFLL